MDIKQEQYNTSIQTKLPSVMVTGRLSSQAEDPAESVHFNSTQKNFADFSSNYKVYKGKKSIADQ